MTTYDTNPLRIGIPDAAPTPARFILSPRFVTLALLTITLIAAALRLYNLAAVQDANTYYMAGVQSMLQSPSNFFFVAAEPGGSVSIDKPPVGLWIQAVSAAIFGVSGVSVVLPQVIAGILSVPLLYWLVRRYSGEGSALIAAAVLAVSPISIAVDRNNTMDSLLILALLIAAALFSRATESEHRRGGAGWLIGGAIMVGVAFNIKMLQAFLPLPAFYALYLLGANTGWRRRLINLAVASVVLAGVSLSWATVVELTPADQRPYVGSSTNNSVFDLIFGYNGLERLTGTDQLGGSAPMGMSAPLGNSSMSPAGAPLMGMGGGMIGAEVGAPGVLRLFSAPLVVEAGWLLPLAGLSLFLIAFSTRLRLPLSAPLRGLVLFGGWLVIGVIFFSVARFFHAYYLAMLAPAIAALVGGGVMALWQMGTRHRALALGLGLMSVGITLGFQFLVIDQYEVNPLWRLVPLSLLAVGVFVLISGIVQSRVAWSAAGTAGIAAALIAIPALWGWLTVTNPPNNTLPTAYNRTRPTDNPVNLLSGLVPALFGGGQVGSSDDLIAYLQANTQDIHYMVAVTSAMEASGMILETRRPVLIMGGFLGSDPVIDAAGIAQLVADGDLRYVYDSPGLGSQNIHHAGISAWLQAHCVADEDAPNAGMPAMLAGAGSMTPPAGFTLPQDVDPAMMMQMMSSFNPTLYDCAR